MPKTYKHKNIENPKYKKKNSKNYGNEQPVVLSYYNSDILHRKYRTTEWKIKKNCLPHLHLYCTYIRNVTHVYNKLYYCCRTCICATSYVHNIQFYSNFLHVSILFYLLFFYKIKNIRNEICAFKNFEIEQEKKNHIFLLGLYIGRVVISL